MKLQAVLAGIAGFLTGMFFSVFVAPQAMAADQVKFRMDWIIEGKYVPFYVARDRGYFEKHGLDVTLIEGRGSLQSATMVDAKQIDYSYGDFMTAVQVMSKGGKNRAIAVGMRDNGGGYIFLKSSGIKTAKDLEGKRFGTNPADFGSVLLPAVAGASGIDDKKIVIRTMEPAVRTPALFEGRIDFIAGANGSSIQRMAVLGKKQGKEVGYLFFKDLGLKAYGHVFQAHEDLIKKNPDQVRRFVTAIYEAWVWCVKNPTEALEVFLKANPQKERDISLPQMEATLEDGMDAETREHGLGYFGEAKVKASVDVANRYLELSPPVDYKITYTNQFVSKTPRM
jgi:NitT/TauT family transport system substrate-binding protein